MSLMINLTLNVLQLRKKNFCIVIPYIKYVQESYEIIIAKDHKSGLFLNTVQLGEAI
jgi:hypothetical protein